MFLSACRCRSPQITAEVSTPSELEYAEVNNRQVVVRDGARLLSAGGVLVPIEMAIEEPGQGGIAEAPANPEVFEREVIDLTTPSPAPPSPPSEEYFSPPTTGSSSTSPLPVPPPRQRATRGRRFARDPTRAYRRRANDPRRRPSSDDEGVDSNRSSSPVTDQSIEQ